MKAIIFDCFGVIYSDPAEVGFNKFATDPERQYAQFHDIFELANRGVLTRKETHRRLAKVLGISVEQWHDVIGSSLVKDESMLALIKQLREDYKTALLTNLGPSRLANYFTDDELKIHFDVAAASGDIGFAKPDRRAFQYVLDELGVEATDTVFVDDRQNYIDGASDMGIKTILFESLHQFQESLKVLSES